GHGNPPDDTDPPVDSPPDTITVPADVNPALTVTKTDDLSGFSSPVFAGDKIGYKVNVKNSGNVTLKNVTVNDPLVGGDITADCAWPGTTGKLIPGQTVVCTASYTLSQDDLDAGKVLNKATATGYDPDGTKVSDTGEVTTDLTKTPGYGPKMKTKKTADKSGLSDPPQVLDPIVYTITATNLGNVTLTGVTVEDALLGGDITSSCTWPTPSKPGVLLPKQTATCTATYLLTQDDLDNGQVTNTAIGKGTPPSTPDNPDPDPEPDEDTITTDVPSAPGLTMHKSAADAAGDPITELVAGEKVYYSFVVTNTGDVRVSAIGIHETDFTGTGTMHIGCPTNTLEPGDSVTCTATYVITQDDVDAGTLKNTAVGYGNPPDDTDPPVESPPDTVVVPADVQPALTVTKTADLSWFSTPVFADDPIGYTVEVKNSGNVTLKNVTVDDPLLGGDVTADCVWPGVSGKLIPGQTASCMKAYSLTQEDLDAGKVTNKATATGYDPDGTKVSDTGEVTTDLTKTPGYGPKMKTEKTADKSGLSDPPQVDDPIVYTITAANIGDVTLTGVTVEDQLLGGDITSSCTWPNPAKPGVLLPKQKATCGGTYRLTQDDLDNAEVANTAIGTGTPPSTPDDPDPEPEPDEVTIVTPIPSAPAISLTKTGALSTTPAHAGDTVRWGFEAKNTGDVNLTNVSITDSLTGLSSITYHWPGPVGVLKPGQVVTGEATYLLTQPDMNAGHVLNQAKVTGTPRKGPAVTANGEKDVTIPQAGTLTMKKIASEADGSPVTVLVVGDTIHYSFVVTNDSNVTVTGISINETSFTGTGTMSAVDCPSTTLTPGASTTCTATYVVTQDDVYAGTLTNTAVGHGNPPDVDSPPDTVTVPEDQKPSLALHKTGALAAGATGVAGDIVEYTFTVTNTGNITVKNISIDDKMIGLSNVTYHWPGPNGMLTPGQQMTATATYTLTQKDVDAGGVHNAATVCDNQAVCDDDSTDVPVTARPELELIKTASINGGPADNALIGQVIEYKFKVTNTGNVTMSSLSIIEQQFTGAGQMSGIDCSATTLAPGEVMYCTASYTVTQGDVDAVQVKNTAVAQGTPPAVQTDPSTGKPVLGNCPTCTLTTPSPITSNTGTALVTMDPDPTLSMVKTANVATFTAGTVITYTFKITNTGNLTISNVNVAEGVFTGSGRMSSIKCPATPSLAPGQAVVCTATYTATSADVAAGVLGNTATAIGDPPNNGITPQNKVQSPPSAVTIRAATVVVQTGGIPAASAGAALPIGLAVFGLLVLGASLLLAPKTRQRRYMPHR
ncbi:MAG: DUF11 domain-containing protein, partial [Propionibacteriaceae bacterium]|nr:DUF11 domain-containing protein [Propionibacteriaceae bacterium]